MILVASPFAVEAGDNQSFYHQFHGQHSRQSNIGSRDLSRQSVQAVGWRMTVPSGRVAETKCMARTPPQGSDPNLPAVQVSWQDASAYAAWL
jgi:formylglycine-generating enzyme required for sulfatase activity